jgi:hypothetical protein
LNVPALEHPTEHMEHKKLRRPWLTLGIRLSLFPVDRWEAPAGLWQELVGEPPEAEQSQPRQQVRVQTGPWRGGVLQLSTNPMGVVWAAAPSPGADGLPDLDKWPVMDIVPAFTELTRPWLKSTEVSFRRVGFGLNAVLSVPDRISAYHILSDLVASVKIDADRTSELFYQINRPVSSQVLGNEIRLNRLMKWSSPVFRVAAMQVMPTGVTPSGLVSEQHYAGLDNDVNTPAERVESLDRGLLGPIYDELVEMALENLEFGELAP